MPHLRPLLGVAAVSCLVALVVLSWLPKEMEVRTGAAGQVEHVVAYAGATFVSLLAWPGRRPRVAAGLVALAAILETGQLWVPGRHADVGDFAASAAGVLAGYAVAVATVRLAQLRTRRRGRMP